jgi:hypothetical protein
VSNEATHLSVIPAKAGNQSGRSVEFGVDRMNRLKCNRRRESNPTVERWGTGASSVLRSHRYFGRSRKGLLQLAAALILAATAASGATRPDVDTASVVGSCRYFMSNYSHFYLEFDSTEGRSKWRPRYKFGEHTISEFDNDEIKSRVQPLAEMWFEHNKGPWVTIKDTYKPRLCLDQQFEFEFTPALVVLVYDVESSDRRSLAIGLDRSSGDVYLLSDAGTHTIEQGVNELLAAHPGTFQGGTICESALLVSLVYGNQVLIVVSSHDELVDALRFTDMPAYGLGYFYGKLLFIDNLEAQPRFTEYVDTSQSAERAWYRESGYDNRFADSLDTWETVVEENEAGQTEVSFCVYDFQVGELARWDVIWSTEGSSVISIEYAEPPVKNVFPWYPPEPSPSPSERRSRAPRF